MCPYIVVVVVDDAAEFVAIDGRFRYHAASCYRAELLKIESCNTFALSMLSSWHEVTSTQDEVTEQCLLRRAAQKLLHTLAWQMFAITWILTSSSCILHIRKTNSRSERTQHTFQDSRGEQWELQGRSYGTMHAFTKNHFLSRKKAFTYFPGGKKSNEIVSK
jgi:hypothetical protein